MALDAHPNFRVNVYGNDPNRVSDIERDMMFGAPRGTGGGFPWFRGKTPSLTYPTATGLPATEPPPTEPPPDQGPPSPTSGIFGNLSGRDLAAVIAALTGITGGALSSRGNTDLTSATSDPRMQELLDLMSGRIRKSEPMFDAVQAMAMGLMPTRYQQPLTSTRQATPNGLVDPDTTFTQGSPGRG